MFAFWIAAAAFSAAVGWLMLRGARAASQRAPAGGPPVRDLAVFVGAAKAWLELSFNAQLPGYSGHRPLHHFVPASAQPDDAISAHWRAVTARPPPPAVPAAAPAPPA